MAVIISADNLLIRIQMNGLFMEIKIIAICEAFVTDITFQEFVINRYMFSQFTPFACLVITTFSAADIPLVSLEMTLQFGLSDETFLTFVALEGLLTRVLVKMDSQLKLSLKILRTFATNVLFPTFHWFFGFDDIMEFCLMFTQICLTCERTKTSIQLTHKRSLSRVLSYMAF